MAGSMALAVQGVLQDAYAAWNTATTDASQRVTVYNGTIPGVPTTRYAVVYAGPPTFVRGSWGAAATDSTGIVTVHFAASRPGTSASPVNEANALADLGVKALVDNTMQVDGLTPDIYLEHVTTEPPNDVAVVTDRVTSEIAAQFTYSAARI